MKGRVHSPVAEHAHMSTHALFPRLPSPHLRDRPRRPLGAKARDKCSLQGSVRCLSPFVGHIRLKLESRGFDIMSFSAGTTPGERQVRLPKTAGVKNRQPAPKQVRQG